jgi:sulfhydrogenase subunit beta (sulfur reductase)
VATYYLTQDTLNQFVLKLTESYRVFSPVKKTANDTAEADYSFAPHAKGEPVLFNPYRAVEPLKSFFTYPREDVCAYFSRDIDEEPVKTVVVGVKACDIAGHVIQDYVFLEGVEVDSWYRLRRENTVFISSDCTDFKKVCHCLAWNILPHPVKGFDLNLTPLNEGFIVETGSSKGEALAAQYKEFFSPAKDSHIAARGVKRDSLIERLKRHLLPQALVSAQNVSQLMKAGYAVETWKEYMRTCVECGGCNLICDTCHCFLLADRKEGAQNSKVRVWDCCLYANYARVGGGGNPLRTRAQRLRNRFMKKFDFFVSTLGIPACCGCGRCIEVCPGKIDIREVLKDVEKRVKNNS